MSIPQTYRRWLLAVKPTGKIVLANRDAATFRLEIVQMPEPGPGQALLRIIMLSSTESLVILRDTEADPSHRHALRNDPAQRIWMDARTNPDRLYHAPMKLGEPIAATGGIGKIVGLAEGSRWKVGFLVSIRSSSWS